MFLGRCRPLLSRWLTHQRTFSTATVAQSVESFPSLLIGGGGNIQATGSFAQSQAEFLNPDPEMVQQLSDLLRDAKMGVVAHYYMDVELQGILTSAKSKHGAPIGIADSLKMGDMAVDMAKDRGVEAVVCLGVDFMSESVQAILTKQGYGHVPVYRAKPQKIGCSLAESAERESYRAWLQKESTGEAALHVVYINTSLETKAVSSSLVPTITCTSSNVLQTILQASAQMGPDLKVMYGPDTYMGNNLETLLTTIVDNWDDDKIRTLHKDHDKSTLTTLRDRMVVFPSGNCIVHHMFGSEVVDLVKKHYYDDCYVTAHLEVPGEMFEIAMQKSLVDQGVVGSTADILNFIKKKVEKAAQSGNSERLRFILGTEAGMVTSIVESVQQILAKNDKVEAEIIFPVAQEAVATSDHPDLAIVPGVMGGEGCSTAGGCATCPFMKMNDVDALLDVITMRKEGVDLTSYLPPNRLEGKTMGGRSAIDLGTESILYMREFMKNKALPSELCTKVMSGKTR